MAPQVVHSTRKTPATRNSVWALLNDSASWPDWTPIDECTVITPAAAGRNEVRFVRNGRVQLREEIVARDPLRGLSYTVLSGLAVRDYRADIELVDDDDTTVITWHTEFRPRVVGTGWLYRRALQRATDQFIDGLVDAAVALGSLPPSEG